ncbi:MAG: hypothetical protein LBB41_06640 [Prevotellaceae bacterium]|jgi:hypothetical protein|nr:hypothetical protein [Prevotellaceae bacterium]
MKTTFTRPDTGLELHLEPQSDSEAALLRELACFGAPRTNQKLKVARVLKKGGLSKIVLKKQTFITWDELRYLGFWSEPPIAVKDIKKGSEKRQIILFGSEQHPTGAPVFAWVLKYPLVGGSGIEFAWNNAEKVLNYKIFKGRSGALYRNAAKRIMTAEQLEIFIKNIVE